MSSLCEAIANQSRIDSRGSRRTLRRSNLFLLVASRITPRGDSVGEILTNDIERVIKAVGAQQAWSQSLRRRAQVSSQTSVGTLSA